MLFVVTWTKQLVNCFLVDVTQRCHRLMSLLPWCMVSIKCNIVINVMLF